METALINRSAETEWAAAIHRFLLAHDVSDLTRQQYRRNLFAFVDWLTANEVQRPTDEDFIRYKRDLSEVRQLSAYTTNGYLSAVRAFYKWAARKGLAENITDGVRGISIEPEFARDPLTRDQAHSVLAACRSAREAALLALLLTTGMRTIEVVRANVGDLRNRGGQVKLMVQGKGRHSKNAFVIIPPQTLDALYAYLRLRINVQPGEPLFVGEGNRNRGRITTRTIRRIVHEVFLRAGICSPRISAHSCRHSAATFALEAGATLEETSKMLRHKDLSTTMIYAHHVDRMKANTEGKVADLLFAS